MNTNVCDDIVQYKTVTGVEKLWQLHDNNFWINYIVYSVEGTWLTGYFLTSHNTPHVLPAFFLLRYVYKIYYPSSWIINNLLDTSVCNAAA